MKVTALHARIKIIKFCRRAIASEDIMKYRIRNANVYIYMYMYIYIYIYIFFFFFFLKKEKRKFSLIGKYFLFLSKFNSIHRMLKQMLHL